MFVRVADGRERRLRFAEPVFLAMQFAVAANQQLEKIRQRIHDRNADSVQTAGNLVGGVVEFAAGMQHGHDDLGGRASFLGVYIHRNATAVVEYRYRFVGVNGDDDPVAMAGQCLVNGVIHNLENHVVKPAAVIGVPDVHAGALTDGVQTF